MKKIAEQAAELEAARWMAAKRANTDPREYDESARKVAMISQRLATRHFSARDEVITHNELMVLKRAAGEWLACLVRGGTRAPPPPDNGTGHRAAVWHQLVCVDRRVQCQ